MHFFAAAGKSKQLSISSLCKCVHTQIMEHLETHNLLSTYQFGFRKHRSTELATVCFLDEIRKAMDNGMITGAIYVDLSKAFDKVMLL